MLKAHQGDYA
ncbi:hypothetical protein ECPA10_2905, partial [Escherichia coli PA10]